MTSVSSSDHDVQAENVCPEVDLIRGALHVRGWIGRW